MNFILIGKGKWGSKLYKNLKKIGNIKKVFRSKDNYKFYNFKNIDWVIVASPNRRHFQQVRFFLKKNINVFCEKPLTENLNLTKNLISLSKKYRTKLYISDIEMFKNKRIKISNKNEIIRSKKCNFSFKKMLYSLAYHDFYILSKYISLKKNRISILHKKHKYFEFTIKQNKKTFNFIYDLNKKPTHLINKTNFKTKKNFIIKMFKNIFYNKVKFEENHIRALKASTLIDRVLKK